MDYRQKEWSKEVSKEHYISYVAFEIVILLYTNRPIKLRSLRVSTRVRAYDRLLPAATAEVACQDLPRPHGVLTLSSKLITVVLAIAVIASRSLLTPCTVQLRGKLTLASESLASATAYTRECERGHSRTSVECSRVLHPSLACVTRECSTALSRAC